MAIHRYRKLALFLAVFLLLPPFLWIGVLVVAPTPWAKRRVVAALESRTGRSVRLEGLAVQPLGGVRLSKLEIGAPGGVDDPWLKASTLRLEIGLAQLFTGKFHLKAVESDGLTLRVLRRADGSFELADFLAPDTEPLRDRDHQVRPRPVTFHVHAGTVALVDEPSHTRLMLHNVEAEGVREGDHSVINHMHGILNGGPFRFAGELDRGIEACSIAGRMQVDDVVLDDGMSVLRYAVPVLAGAPLHLKGQLDADVEFNARAATWAGVLESLQGKGVIAINPIDLDGAPLLTELSKVAELSRQGRVASIRTDFMISDRRITTEDFTLTVGNVPMTLSGWTDFDGKLDYRINLAGLDKRLPENARRFLGDLNVKLERLNVLTLQGTVSRMVVQLNGLALDQDFIRDTRLQIKKEDREKLRGMARQFLDQLSR
jgi:AsmA protein